MKNKCFLVPAFLLLLSAGLIQAQNKVINAQSPVTQPYPYISNGRFSAPAVPESPDPLVAYRWPKPSASDGLEIYLLRPQSVTSDQNSSFSNLASLTGVDPDVLVTGTGSIRMDFGRETASWIEFDSPDCPGGVEMSISEYDEPGVEKTAVPVQYGHTWRLELNKELYDGVRFAWIHVKTIDKQWHITGIRAICQVKPTNYNGSFSCSDPVLTRSWYMSAYGVRASFCKDYFGAIIMERGDRISWTGDAHPSQAAALVAFGDYDFIRKNIDNTSGQNNGIRSYSLYWVLSLLDYYQYTGDTATMNLYTANACKKLDDAFKVFGTNPGLHFYGWDDRLCAGFEIWFKQSEEAQNAYKMLSIRAWNDFSRAMGFLGRSDLKDKYETYAREKMAALRKTDGWYRSFGLHAAADAINTGLLTRQEEDYLYGRWFCDRVNRVSLSPFNQYFIIQALARMQKHDDALSSVRDMWGGMLAIGGTTPFETYRPSWNRVIAPNGAVPNTQSGITSLCHPWGAGVVKWLNEEVLGIVPVTPGFQTYDILPHPGGTLTRVSGKTPTPFGDIQASFDLNTGRCTVSAPAGTTGRIGIPRAGKAIRKISINGKTAWDGSFRPVQGIGRASEDAEFVYFTGVRPGTYDISVSYSGATPVYREAPEEYAAGYLKTDTVSGGNWGGTYGTAGYVLCNYDGQGHDRQSLPPFVKSVTYFRAFPKDGLPDPTVWAGGTRDKRALAPEPGNGFPRNAACYSNSDQTMTATIETDNTKSYQIALYFVDWDSTGSRAAVEMMDAETLNLIAPVQVIKDYSGGRYLVFRYNKSVKFRIDRIRGGNISLSGIFFD